MENKKQFMRSVQILIVREKNVRRQDILQTFSAAIKLSEFGRVSSFFCLAPPVYLSQSYDAFTLDAGAQSAIFAAS